MSEKKWRALDHCDTQNNDKADVSQEADQINKTKQQSFEWIIVRDSEGVDITTTDTQVAVSLQAAIQVAIALVISITVGDSATGKAVVEELKQYTKIKQRNSQKTVVLGSRNITVTTTDTQAAVNIQALLQFLLAIVAKLEIA